MSAKPEALRRPRRNTHPLSAKLLFGQLDGLVRGELSLLTPEGERLHFRGPAPGPRAELRLRHWSVCRHLLLRGDIGFGADYRDGLWETPDLRALLQLAADNAEALSGSVHGRRLVNRLYRLRHLRRANTRRGSRENIHAHYDLGNDFYRLWLDPSMSYSAALFEEDAQELQQAQHAKYERLLAGLDLRPGDHLLEIGCGWGGFAAYAARSRDVKVTAITLSEAQLGYARERIAREGLDDRVRIELMDYRDLRGRYDAIASIEMLEAVGEAWWPSYFATVHDLLRPGGRAGIQVITMADAHFEHYRSGTDFIQQYIFPGGMLPSPGALDQQTEAAGLVTLERFDFGRHYADTLQRWLARFDEQRDRVLEQGFDEPFIRLWRFYLAYCEAGFRSGRTDVRQLTLARA